MNRWNAAMASHFAGFPLIAEGFDQCRGREAKAHVIPGDPDNFGITDGTDSWVIPARAGAAGTIFAGFDVAAWLRRYFAGERPEPHRAAPRVRRRAALDDPDPDPAPRRRRAALDETPSPTDQPTTATRRRHVTV